MDSGDLLVTIRVEYGFRGGDVAVERVLIDSSGNPRYAPRAIEQLMLLASADIQSAVAAVTGDIREQRSA